ncbi:hypothetical protein SGRIM128S_06391 [Streptomyces griseomycini]
MTMSTAEADKILSANFAPWVLGLGLSVEAVEYYCAVLRLPWSQRLAREGGALSGQALMAAADTATVIAVSAARGAYGPMTTVQQSTSFQRAVTGSDILVEGGAHQLGRRMAFADITMTVEESGLIAARASTVYALLGLTRSATGRERRVAARSGIPASVNSAQRLPEPVTGVRIPPHAEEAGVPSGPVCRIPSRGAQVIGRADAVRHVKKSPSSRAADAWAPARRKLPGEAVG